MAYGITTYRANGSVMMDGLVRGGVLVGVMRIPAGAGSGSQKFPRTSSNKLSFVYARDGGHQITLGPDSIGTSGGFEGTIYWQTGIEFPGFDETVLYVFCTGVAVTDSFGLMTVNDFGETLVDPGFPLPQFVETALLSTSAALKYNTPDGYTAHVHRTAVINPRPAADKLVLMAMPDVGANDTWYALKKDYILAGEGSVQIEVVVYTQAASYQLPSLHVYAVNSLEASSDTFGLRLFDNLSRITFDSGVESMVTREQLQVSMPSAGGNTATYSLPSVSMPGVTVPYYYESKFVAVGNNWINEKWVGVGKRVGSQYTVWVLKDANAETATKYGNNFKVGGNSLRYCPVVELAQQGGQYSAGTPAATLSTYPGFATHPANADVKTNTAFTLSVATSGTPAPTLRWFKNDVDTGQTGTTYNGMSGNEGQTQYIYCLATNVMGSVASSTATVLVSDATMPVISNISPAKNALLSVGSVQNLSFTATGTAAITKKVKLSDGSFTSSGTYQWTVGAGLQPVQVHALSGPYTAFENLDYVSANPSQITTQPSNANVNEGDTAVFTLSTAASSAAQTFKWYRAGTLVSTKTNNASYSVVATLGMNGQALYCTVENGFGGVATSNTVYLYVSQVNTAPTIVTAASSRNCDEGETTVLSVAANGYPAPTITWTIGGVNVGTGASITISPSGTGSKTAIATASNGSGTATSSTTFFVFADFTVTASQSPTSTTVASGTSVTLTGRAVGGNAAVTVSWLHPDGGSTGQANYSNNTDFSIIVTASNTTAGTYTFSAQYTGAGPFVDNQASATRTISIGAPATPAPVFSTNPSPISVTRNGTAIFSAAASNTTTYTWYRDGVSQGTGANHNANTATDGTFQYQCKAVGPGGTTWSSPANLTVTAPASVGYTNHSNVSKSITVIESSVEIAITAGGQVYVDGVLAGTWGSGGSGNGSGYDVVAGGNFTPASGSFAFDTSYSFSEYSGCSWYTPESTGVPGNITFSFSASISRNGTGVSSVSVNVTMRTF